ncbi:NAD-P-binding protein [Daedaleopsis nitida]|nr:NAD-P-binding protein [Daedaleopsis nitida]
MSSTTDNIWFITGTNRGIGLEMTRQLLESPLNTIIAACRNPLNATALNELANDAKGQLHVVKLVVDDERSIRACANEVAQIIGDKGVDYVVNNAAVNTGHEDYAYSMDVGTMVEVFKTNVAGPAYVAQAFRSLLEKSRKKTIVNISSTLGSVGSDFGAWHASYSVTKAALNMLTYKLAKDRPDITVVSMCPGWLQTDMGGPGATHPVSVGAGGMLNVIQSLTPEKTGKFFNFKGEEVPW